MQVKTKKTETSKVIKLVPVSTRRKVAPPVVTDKRQQRRHGDGGTIIGGPSKAMAQHMRAVKDLTDQLVAVGMKKIDGPWKGDVSVLDSDFCFVPVARKGRAYALVGVDGIAIDFKARIGGQLVDIKAYGVYATAGSGHSHTSIQRWFGYHGDCILAQEADPATPLLLQVSTRITSNRDRSRMAKVGAFNVSETMQGLWLDDVVLAGLRKAIAAGHMKGRR